MYRESINCRQIAAMQRKPFKLGKNAIFPNNFKFMNVSSLG